MTTMIALVGEQTLPNLLPVRHYHPDNVLFIYTDRTEKQFVSLKNVTQKDANVSGLKTHPYDILSIGNAIDNKIEGVVQPLIFNLTGGTKAMCLAAYQVAQRYDAPVMYLQSEGKLTRVYHYTWQEQRLRLSGEARTIPECIVLQDVFDLYIGSNQWQPCGSKREGNTTDKGCLFENALATVLRKDGYDVMVGVRAMGGQLDIDLAIRWGNQYGIIEAKVDKGGKELKGIQQLHTGMRHLGTYSRTFYVITVEPESRQEAIVDISGIKVISLTGYNSNTHTLSSEDETKLLETIGEALKG